jgi:hypothetical protein
MFVLVRAVTEEKYELRRMNPQKLRIDPPSLGFGATRRRRRLWRGIRLCQGYDVTRATTVAPGIERGELGSEEETDLCHYRMTKS